MVVVFDSQESNRARFLRAFIYEEGYPCAICNPDTISKLLPIGLIVTFTDQIDVIRHMPYDDIPVIAYGDGFVNSALNAVRAKTLDDILEGLRDFVIQRFGINERNCLPGLGAFFYPGVFMAIALLIVYGSRFTLTDNELYIIRCLILSGDCHRSSKQLAEYCLSGTKNETSIRVHICAINKKGEKRLPSPLIESKHGLGYRFGYIDDHSVV